MKFKAIFVFAAGWSAIASAQVDPLAPLPTAAPPAPSIAIHRGTNAGVQVAPVQASAPATYASVGTFESYKQVLAAHAVAAGVRQATVDNVVPYLRLNSTVMRLDRAQPGNINNPNSTPPFAPYRRSHVTPDLISRGQANYRSLWPHLSRIEQRTGVPASIMLAIWGKETSYGRVKGTFDIFDALATLAYEGRRRDLFEGEFIAAMKLIDQGVPRSRLKGSWAGAMGHPQFMPTNILKLRVDGDGDGDADIWGSQLDGLASIGNYLQQAGWKAGMLWGVPVRVPPTLDRNAIRNPVPAAKCPRVHARHSVPMSWAQWRARGVVPLDRSLRDTDMATLIEPDGPYETAYLVTDNYRAVLDYNCSNFYALSVTLLADGIIGR
nr:lytic murein transglycosylase [uncultured Sphingomonas sp.]